MEPRTAQRTHILKRIRLGYNPRGEHDEEHVKMLMCSVKELGVLEPLLVIAVNDDPNYDFETNGGEHRYRAALATHGEDFLCPIRELHLTPIQLMAARFVSNLHLQMSVGAEAKGAQMVLTECRNDKAEAAKVLGWSLDKLEARLCLTACTDEVLEALKHKRIKLGHAELLAGLKPASQNMLVAGVIASGTSVSVLKAQIRQAARKLSDAPFDTAQCQGCEHNSARQAGLFGESIGDGYCQHPRHFDELTDAFVHAKAESLKETYQVIKIYRAEDGFLRIPVAPDGEHAVGEAQYVGCQQCANFGCAVSNMAGSQGEVTASLCFDAVCNDTKRFDYRKGLGTIGDTGAENEPDAGGCTTAQPAKTAGRIPNRHGMIESAATRVKAGNEVGKKVMAYRLDHWRKWLAQALINDSTGEQSARVMFALVMAGKSAQIDTERFARVASQIDDAECGAHSDIGTTLEWAGRLNAASFGQLQQTIAASAAFGVEEGTLVRLLEFVGVNESRFFTLDESLLGLLSKAQLTGLAKELGLFKKLPSVIVLNDAKKADFIKALLTIKGQRYRGLVPAVMKYPRSMVRKEKGERKRIAAVLALTGCNADGKGELAGKTLEPQAKELGPVIATAEPELSASTPSAAQVGNEITMSNVESAALQDSEVRQQKFHAGRDRDAPRPHVPQPEN